MRKTAIICMAIAVMISFMAGCAANKPMPVDPATQAPAPLTMLAQIDSFKPEVACSQALEVVNSNPYEQVFFEAVFAKIVEQCRNSRKPENADLIWTNFVAPLQKSGKVPPDMVKYLWNCYFSRQFVSLPTMAPVSQQCFQLAEIKKNLEKEYQLKKAGFEICRQGTPDTHFLNAMYVYNTMWAACKGTD